MTESPGLPPNGSTKDSLNPAVSLDSGQLRHSRFFANTTTKFLSVSMEYLFFQSTVLDHESFYQVQGVLYKPYIHPLSTRCVVFRDMFALPQNGPVPPQGDDEASPICIPVIQEKFDHFLEYIYNGLVDFSSVDSRLLILIFSTKIWCPQSFA